MAKNESNLESMDELLDRLANKLKVGDKASAAGVRAELNRIDEEYNKPELRAFVRDLYKQMIHPDHGVSLAFIGFARPQQGGVPAVAEMQSRYFAQLCSGTRTLPSKSGLLDQAREDRERWETEYSITPHVSSLVNYSHYMESLAHLVGCEPEIPSVFRDPVVSSLDINRKSLGPCSHSFTSKSPAARPWGVSCVTSMECVIATSHRGASAATACQGRLTRTIFADSAGFIRA